MAALAPYGVQEGAELNIGASHTIAVYVLPKLLPHIKIEHFMDDQLCLILPPNHRWAKKTTLRAAEIVQEPILSRESGSGMRRFVEEYLEKNGVLSQQLRTTVDMNSTEAILSAVEAGLGIGFVPEMALGKALQATSVVVIPLENGPIKRQFSIAMLGGQVTAGPVRDLVALLHSISPRSSNVPEKKTLRGRRP